MFPLAVMHRGSFLLLCFALTSRLVTFKLLMFLLSKGAQNTKNNIKINSVNVVITIDLLLIK